MENSVIQLGQSVAYRRRQRGASLLEGIAYLGIAAIVILGAVSLLTSAFSNAQSNRAVEEVISLRTAVRKLYSGQSYPAAITPTMVAARAVPGTLTVDTLNNTVTNAWGGAVTLVGAGGSFVIQYAGVPQDVCINMVSGASGWTQIDRNNANPTTTFPVSAAVASTICSASSNTLNFTAS